MGLTKNFKSANEKFDKTIQHSLEDAVSFVKEASFAKFDETVDIVLSLGVDPRHADQNILITTGLPNGTGKTVSVLVITQGPKEAEAKEAGADFVGGKEYLDKIKGGWANVDKIIATPDMMSELGKLGRILGPRGLMPNPKTGTVTMDVAQAVKEIKAGKIELRVDKAGNVHAPCGKVSFEKSALVQNIQTIYDAIMKAKPGSVKGVYLKKLAISSTMGPGVKIDPLTVR